MLNYQAGDLIEVQLERVAFGGEAVGRLANPPSSDLSGLVIFVRGGLDGERVMARITHVKKNLLKADVTEVLTPSAHRVQPLCSVYGQCGGCQYQHIDYAHQLCLKEAQVRDSLERIGRLKDFELEPIAGSPDPFHYRNRVDFHIFQGTQDFKIGFVNQEGRRVIDVEDCPISAEAIVSAYQQVRAKIRQGQFEIPGWAQVIKFWDTAEGPRHFLLNLHGKVPFTENTPLVLNVAGKKFKAHPLSFFQVNLPMIEKMAECVERFLDLRGNEFLFDGYCGVGLFAILLGNKVRSCVGAESDPHAIEYAKLNAQENGVTHCEFWNKSVEKILKHPERFFKEKPDRVILDPTRAGCDPMVLEALVKLEIPKIVYVSCNPTTLARDLGILKDKGYILKKAKPFDLFPQTKHCEVVALIERT